MKNFALIVIIAFIFTGCNSESKRAMAEADAATRDYIRSQVRHTYNLVEIYNDKLTAFNEISKDTLKYMLMDNIDTLSVVAGIDKLKGDKLFERQKEIEQYLKTVRQRIE